MHDANMFAQQGMGHCRTLALRASQSHVYRESQLDEQSLSLLLREKRREKRAERENEKSTKEENEGRERRKREGTRKREEIPPPSPFLSLLTVCRFKTSPCVGSKRFRVCRQNARMCAAYHRASGGARRVTMSYLCPHCSRFPMEDSVWWVSGGKKHTNWWCVLTGLVVSSKPPVSPSTAKRQLIATRPNSSSLRHD